MSENCNQGAVFRNCISLNSYTDIWMKVVSQLTDLKCVKDPPFVEISLKTKLKENLKYQVMIM